MKTSVIPAGLVLAGEIEGRGELVVAGVRRQELAEH